MPEKVKLSNTQQVYIRINLSLDDLSDLVKLKEAIDKILSAFPDATYEYSILPNRSIS